MYITEDGQIQSEAPQTYLIEGKNKKRKKKQKKHRMLRKVIKAIFITLLIIFLLIIAGGGYFAYKVYNIVKDVEISETDLAIKIENSVLKDSQGNILGVLNGNENRESIPLR